ncbi:MAG: hypothetical protein ACRENL_00865 [Candidatus Dormibacteria bacterium]
MHAALRSSLAELSASPPALRAAVSTDRGGRHDGRRVCASAQQTLDRLGPVATLGESDTAARLLLAAAAEEASWAWRMLQAADAPSPGVAAAVAVLADHAADCCDEALRLLAIPAPGEPGDRP